MHQLGQHLYGSTDILLYSFFQLVGSSIVKQFKIQHKRFDEDILIVA